MTSSVLSNPLLANMGSLDRFCRQQLIQHLQRLQHGSIVLVEGHEKQTLGAAHADLQVQLTVTDNRFYQKVVLGGSVGAGEAYIDGFWRCDDLTALIRIFVRNMALLDQLESGWARLSKPALKLLSWRQRNTLTQARKNISAHYDLGNAMYQLFLDASMMYSSAVYPHEGASLEQAQQHKLAQICDKLQLSPTDHLIEIGTGWGSLAIFAAKNYGCKVTTTTISAEQHAYAKAAIEAAGLTDRITLLFEDYRLLTGRYTKLVSIEMIEAVGHDYLGDYFAKCASLLTDDGLMLIQAITIADQRYEHYRQEVDFIQKFVFPGGCLPSITQMASVLCQRTDLVIRKLDDIGLHYAKTLADWCQRFMANRDAVHKLGYDDRFVRLWHFYLCYCEGGFIERATSAIHLVMSKPGFKATV